MVDSSLLFVHCPWRDRESPDGLAFWLLSKSESPEAHWRVRAMAARLPNDFCSGLAWEDRRDGIALELLYEIRSYSERRISVAPNFGKH